MSGRRPRQHQRRPRQRQERHEDTVVAYHNYLQHLIKERLNAINLGPAKVPFRLAIIFYAWGLACCVVGILVIGLRNRHLYLTGVWSRFVGPLFIIFFLLSFGAGTYFLQKAKRKSNKYRRDLRFQPLGQYGVKVVHTTRLPHEKTLREEYKTGTTPHISAKPPRQSRPYPQRYGQQNRGYMPENGHRDYGREYGREQGPQYGREYAPQRGREYAPERGREYAPQHSQQHEHHSAGPPDVIPGKPRQYKSRVVIQQQQPHHQRQPQHGTNQSEEDSSV